MLGLSLVLTNFCLRLEFLLSPMIGFPVKMFLSDCFFLNNVPVVQNELGLGCSYIVWMDLYNQSINQSIHLSLANATSLSYM